MPARGTYTGLEPGATPYVSSADSGIVECGERAARILGPLTTDAIYELGFALEFGALSTWSN